MVMDAAQRNCRWHQILLNQSHELLKKVDMTSKFTVTPEEKAEADRWLRIWVDWNAERLEFINSIKTAPGGLWFVCFTEPI